MFQVRLIPTLVAALCASATAQDRPAPQAGPQENVQIRVEQQWGYSVAPDGVAAPLPQQPIQRRHAPGYHPPYQPGFGPGYGPGYRPGYPPGYGPGYQPGYGPGYGYGPQIPYYPAQGAYYGSTTYRIEPTGPYQYWRRPGWDFTRPLPGGTYGANGAPVRPVTFPCLEGRPCNQ